MWGDFLVLLQQYMITLLSHSTYCVWYGHESQFTFFMGKVLYTHNIGRIGRIGPWSSFENQLLTYLFNNYTNWFSSALHVALGILLQVDIIPCKDEGSWMCEEEEESLNFVLKWFLFVWISGWQWLSISCIKLGLGKKLVVCRQRDLFCPLLMLYIKRHGESNDWM